MIVFNLYKSKLENEIDRREKMDEFYEILIRWLELKQKKISLKSYFVENNYQTAAVYGMKEIGILLYKELLEEGVQVICGIDKNFDEIDTELPVIAPDKNIPDVDVIIVTAAHYFNSIHKELVNAATAEIVSIEDVLWGIGGDR